MGCAAVAGRKPLTLLLEEFPEALGGTGNQKEVELPAVMQLGDLKSPTFGDDPTELIGHRFLYRGGVCLLLGPTGIGKSALLMQIGIHLAVGRGLFGIEPGACYTVLGMKVLLVQAENDEGDLAEMRDGVMAGCTGLSGNEKELAARQMMVTTMCDRSGERFTESLGSMLVAHGPFDVVIVDPAFAYLGGDSNSQRDVSRFMRELLNPLLQKHSVGMILAHHTNKPLRGKEKDSWAAGDFAYLGAGSAEWINPARAALALRSIGSDRLFELRAAKRGRRLGWRDEDGLPTNVQHIAHSDEPGVICWRAASNREVEDVLTKDTVGRPRKCSVAQILKMIGHRPGESQVKYTEAGAGILNCSKTAVQNAIRDAEEKGFLTVSEVGKRKCYRLSSVGLGEVGGAVATTNDQKATRKEGGHA